jgi:hypothetical protein
MKDVATRFKHNFILYVIRNGDVLSKILLDLLRLGQFTPIIQVSLQSKWCDKRRCGIVWVPIGTYWHKGMFGPNLLPVNW